MLKKDKLVTILGATASGKTSLSIKLAKKFNGEIVCADSRTIYQGMSVGTAKPTRSEQGGVKHHLIDICSPDKPFSAAEYKKAAQKAIDNIKIKNKLPFLVGGSGMYIDAVLYNYKFRNTLSLADQTKIKEMSLTKLSKLAQQKYPKEYLKIDTNNRRRVEQLISKGPSKDNDRKRNIPMSLVLGLYVETPLLKQNIATRTKYMLNNNFIQEVENLLKNYGQTDILLHTTGYAQVIDYLHGKYSIDDLEAKINNATWQLSRKQLTWFRRNKHISWIQNISQAEEHVYLYLHTQS